MKKRINKVRQQAPAKQTRSNVSFVNLSSYTTPEIVESRNKDWIEFGAENDYFNVLIDKAKGSATNGACINSISQMIYGKGLSATDSARRPEQYARMVSLFKKDDLRKFAYDLKLSDEPLRIPAFGVSDTPKPIEILYVKPYEAGMYYYSTPDWAKGGLQYADLEIEVSNYHINNVRNGLSPSMLVNFNNGVPEKPKRDEMERQILNKYQGTSRAGTPIIAFNDNKENAGFGNNAEELKDSSILMQNVVIAPFQELLIDAFDKILAFNKISLNLYFKTLQPLQFLDLDNVEDKETKEEETGVKMKQMFSSLEEFGEDEDLKEWDLIDERKVDYDAEDSLDEEVDKLNNPKLSVLSKIYNFATTGAARPKAKSKQDGENQDGVQFKVRYQYAPLTFSESSREFCKKMVRAAKIYRKEDIQQMSKKAVNAGWGLKGSDNYDIWLYKGGGGCHHFWMRKTYRAKNAKTTPDVGNPNAEVSVNKAKKEGFKPEVNAKEVSKRPVDMPNNGFVNK